MTSTLRPIAFSEGVLKLIDQRKLPSEEVFVDCHNVNDVHHAIKSMIVRGAPCIGFTALYGLALSFKDSPKFSFSEFEKVGAFLKTARPTAVNLAFEIDRVTELVKKELHTNDNIFQKVLDYANYQFAQSDVKNRSMGQLVAKDLYQRTSKDKLNILTHCNTGYLACGSFGTALGAIQTLFQDGRLGKVWVDETRPYLQGSRLTAFELGKLGIPHEVVVEGAASYLMANAMVDGIVVGADRIAGNGDTANKIGTANLGIIAKHFQIPFYVLAPKSSFDPGLSCGKEIPVELRDEEEILQYKDFVRFAPKNSKAFNPSFDITPHECITAIACESILLTPSYEHSIKREFLA